MTTVHNFSKEISKIVPWDLAISFQIVVKDINRDCQVTNIERIGPIPTLGTEFSSFTDDSVEIAQRVENGFEFIFSRTHFKRILIKVVQGLVKISQNTGWRFVGNFNRRFENTLR